MKRYLSILCAGVLVFAVAGCGKAKEEVTGKVAEKIAEKAAESALKKDGAKDAKVDIKKDGGVTVETTNEKGEKTTITSSGGSGGGTFTSTSAEGTSVIGEGAKIPADFPKDIPVYPNGKLMAAMTNKENGGTTALTFESADPVSKIGEHFKKEMAAQGWTTAETSEMTGDSPMVMLNFTKGELKTFVMAMGEGGKTTISLTVTKN